MAQGSTARMTRHCRQNPLAAGGATYHTPAGDNGPITVTSISHIKLHVVTMPLGWNDPPYFPHGNSQLSIPLYVSFTIPHYVHAFRCWNLF